MNEFPSRCGQLCGFVISDICVNIISRDEKNNNNFESKHIIKNPLEKVDISCRSHIKIMKSTCFAAATTFSHFKSNRHLKIPTKALKLQKWLV